jgi:hypothetical protein
VACPLSRCCCPAAAAAAPATATLIPLLLCGWQTCQVDGLVAAGRSSGLDVQQLVRHMRGISRLDVELAKEQKYTRSAADRDGGVEFLCAKDVYWALRHRGHFGGSGDWAPGTARNAIAGLIRARDQAGAFQKLPQSKKQQLLTKR